MMGQAFYVLTAPAFTRATLRVGDPGHGREQRTLVIEAPAASPTHLYIAGASLDGAPLDRAWVWHDEIVGTGKTGSSSSSGSVVVTLRLELSETPHPTWGRAELPPSPLQHVTPGREVLKPTPAAKSQL